MPIPILSELLSKRIALRQRIIAQKFYNLWNEVNRRLRQISLPILDGHDENSQIPGNVFMS